VNFRIGNGFDVHAFAAGRRLVIGGVTIPYEAQVPKLAPHIEAMRRSIAADLGCDPSQVSVKATTSERLGFTGREEGIAALANVLLVAMPDVVGGA
jgi:2-C-methyl-D-erythritol 2,4-cyclodiphosphate synthase